MKDMGVKSDVSLESLEGAFHSPPMKQMPHERSPLKGDPSRTLSPSSVVENVVQDQNANPFFIGEWFKQLCVSEKENTASSAFKTPEKKQSGTTTVSLQESSSSLVTTTPTPTKFPPNSPFQKQSEAVGSGWNAKGLQKARNDDWEGALECWRMALDIRQQVLGEHHKDVSNTHNNLGIALGRLGRDEEAMEHLQKALTIRLKLYGATHQDTAATHHNIANVYQQTGACAAALESFHAARRIQQELAGDNSVQVARAWNAIGHLYFETQQYGKAKEAYSKALEAFRKSGRDEQDMEVEHTKLDLQEAEELLLPSC